MESRRSRSKNFTEREKVILSMIVADYREIIENKGTDGVTVAKKKLAWHEIAEKFNSQAESGYRTDKQLHALHDNLKKSTRNNANATKREAFVPERVSFMKERLTPIEEKNVALLEPQFTSDQFGLSATFIKEEAIEDPLMDEELPSTSAEEPHSISPTPISESITHTSIEEQNVPSPKSVEELEISTVPQKSRFTHISPRKRKACTETLTNRFIKRKNFKDTKDEELHKKKLEILEIEKQIKLKQLQALIAQNGRENELLDLKIEHQKMKVENEKKMFEINNPKFIRHDRG